MKWRRRLYFLIAALMTALLLAALLVARRSVAPATPEPLPYQARFGWGPTSTMTARLISSFERAADWSTARDNGVGFSVENVPGRTGNALRLTYDFPPGAGNWACVSMPLPITLPEAGRFAFMFRANGPPNNLELKLIDADGGVWLRHVFAATNTSDWRPVEIDLREFRYGWGGTNTVMDPPLRIEFTVARGFESTSGGAGWIDLDDLVLLGENPRLELAMSQVGFTRGAPMQAVLRLVNAGGDEAELPRVAVMRHGETLPLRLAGVTPMGRHAWGGIHWVADFSELYDAAPGWYELEAVLPRGETPITVRSYPFEIGDRLLARRTGGANFHYIRSTRYPAQTPHHDPVPGGYIDTEFDIEKWMTTTPSWTWGMARFARFFPAGAPGGGYDPLEEIAYAADFMIAMQDSATGGVWVGVNKRFEGNWPNDVRAEEDEKPRYLNRNHGLDINTTYAAAMAEVALALGPTDPERAARSLRAAVLAWEWCARQNISVTADMGNFVWAATRLHEATGETSYLARARPLVAALLTRQMRPPEMTPEGVSGRFFSGADRAAFVHQHKFVHSTGIQLGLIEYAELLPPEDPLRGRIIEALDLFATRWLRATATGTPYGVVGQALERDRAGRWRLLYFASSSTFCDHGLNCDILAMGLIALRYARLTGDRAFESLAWDQANWVLGKNPFGFSMISGVGWTNAVDFCSFYRKGPILGGLVNGLVAPGEGDNPVYAVDWNSGEYWKPHNAMWLALVAELEGTPPAKR